MSDKRSWGLPLAVFLVVLSVRLVALSSLERDVLSRWPAWTETDEHGTLVWAERLAAGNWLDSPPFRHFAAWQRRFGTPEQWNSWYPRNAYYQGALYPYLVAFARLAFGDPVFPVRLLQHLLAAAAAAALAAASRNLAARAGSPRASLAAGATAGLAVGLYGPAVFHDGFVQRDGPLLSLSTILLAAPFLSPARTVVGGALTGLLGGLTALFKQTAVPMALASTWAVVRSGEGGALRSPGRRRVAAGVLGLAIPLAFLIGRNVAAGASPFAYDTRQVVGFAGYVARGSDGSVVPSPLMGDILAEAKGSTGRALELAVLSYRENPVALVVLTGKKIATFFHGFEVPDNANFYLFQRRLFPLRFLPVYACLLGPGLVGLFLAARRRLFSTPETLAVLAGLLVPFVSSVIPSITSRYRLGIAAPLALGAGLLVAHLLSEAPGRRKAGAVAAALAVSAVTLLPPVIPASRFRWSDEAVFDMLRTGRM